MGKEGEKNRENDRGKNIISSNLSKKEGSAIEGDCGEAVNGRNPFEGGAGSKKGGGFLLYEAEGLR